MFLDVVPYQSKNESFASIVQQEKIKLIHHLNIQRGSHVLVVCPGEGEELDTLARLVGKIGRLTIVDVSRERLEAIEARKESGAFQINVYSGQPHPSFVRPQKCSVEMDLILFNGRNLEFNPNHFDAVWCPGIGFIDQQQLTPELYRVVKPGGVIAILD